MEQLMLSMGEDLQVTFYFGLLLSFLLIERLLPKRRPAEPQAGRWRTNAGLTLLTILTLPVLPTSFIAVAFWAQANGFGFLNVLAPVLPAIASILLTLLIRGFISFGTHYLNHRVPVLWRIHRIHHLDTELDVSSTVRFHPLEMPLSLLIGIPAVALCGLSKWALILYELLDVSVTLFSHSNIRLHPRLDRYLRYLIVTPDLHRVHHSTHQPETDSNFSAVFPIWDILFGTFRTVTRAPQETMPLGLSDIRDPQANRIWWLLVAPFLPMNPPPPASEPLPSPMSGSVGDSHIGSAP